MATRERGGWLAAERPAYHSGGWGRRGTGDADGANRWDNMVMLVRAVGGTLDVLPVKALDVKLIGEEIEKFEARKKLLAYARKIGRYTDLEFSARDTELKTRRKVTGIHGEPRGEDLNLGIFDAETGEALDNMFMLNVYGDNRDRSRKLNLWKVVPNTTVANFTIQGDVD